MFVIFLRVIYLKKFIRIFLYSSSFIFIRNLFIYLFNLFIVFIYFIYYFIYLFILLFYLFIYLFVYLFIYLFTYLFIYLLVQFIERNKVNLEEKEERRLKEFQPSNFSIFCQCNYMKIHFASALPRQYFCRGWQGFILRASAFTSATSEKTSTGSKGCKVVRLLLLLHMSLRIRSIICTITCCTNIFVQILLYAMQCALFSRQTLCFKIILEALF